MRGRQRIQVVALFAASAAFTGALTGFLAGLVWAAVSAIGWDSASALTISPAVAAAIVGTAALADVASTRWRRLSPLCLGRQVPQAWGRLFPPPTVAVLYGARLGSGPMTILSTWMWWAAVVIAASLGPLPAAIAGAVFGVVRIIVIVAASSWAESAMATRVARLAARDGITRVAASAVAVVVAVAVVSGALFDSGTPDETATSRNNARAPSGTANTRDTGGERRAATDDADQRVIPVDPAVEGLLVDDLGPEWERIPDERSAALGPLDLTAAARAEEDVHAERALLETRRFRIGHARAWRSGTERTAYVAVYEFGSDTDAEAYLVDGRITLEGRGAAVYAVEEPAGALGFSQADESASGTGIAHGVVFVRGHHFFLVIVTGADASAEDARIAALAQDTRAISAEKL